MDPAKIGARIKKVRKSRKLTQKELANALGIDQGHISKIERGFVEPSRQIIKSICHYFRCREAWLISGEGSKNILSREDLDDFLVEIEIAQKLPRNSIKSILVELEKRLMKVEDKIITISLANYEISQDDNELMTLRKRIEDRLNVLNEAFSDLKVEKK